MFNGENTKIKAPYHYIANYFNRFFYGSPKNEASCRKRIGIKGEKP